MRNGKKFVVAKCISGKKEGINEMRRRKLFVQNTKGSNSHQGGVADPVKRSATHYSKRFGRPKASHYRRVGLVSA